MFHKMRQVLHECVIVCKCESTFTQFHRVIKTCQNDTKQLVGHLIGKSSDVKNFEEKNKTLEQYVF